MPRAGYLFGWPVGADRRIVLQDRTQFQANRVIAGRPEPDVAIINYHHLTAIRDKDVLPVEVAMNTAPARLNVAVLKALRPAETVDVMESSASSSLTQPRGYPRPSETFRVCRSTNPASAAAAATTHCAALPSFVAIVANIDSS